MKSSFNPVSLIPRYSSFLSFLSFPYTIIPQSAKTGIYSKVAEAERTGRTKFEPLINIYQSMDKLVRRRDHVLIDMELLIMVMVGLDFTFHGNVDKGLIFSYA